MPDITPAAPAQPAPSAPVTAVHQAVAANDFAAFETAERAALSGKPLPSAAGEPPAPVAEPSSAPVAEEPKAPALSKRQQDANDRIRRAVEAATADLTAENARLKALVPKGETNTAPTKQEPPAPAPEAEFPDYAKYLETHPDATLEAWMNAWYRHNRELEKKTDRDEQDRTARSHAEREEDEQFRTRLAEAAEKGVDVKALFETPMPFLDLSLPPEVLARTFPGIDAMSTVVRRSEVSVNLLQHFKEHPDVAERIARMERGHAFREICKLEGALERDLAQPATPSAPKPKTIPSAPAPPVNLGNRTTSPADPSKSAVQANDYAAFEQAEFQKLAGARR